jgi:hypothetical protein
MGRTLLAIVAAASAALPLNAGAQLPDEGPSVHSPIATDATQSSSSREVWWREDLADAKARSTRTRNALIATSAAVGLGVVFIAVGSSQCQSITRPDGDLDLLCNNTGDVLWPLGMGISVLGAIGMLTSGIVLGVSNRRQRKIQREIRQSSYGRRLQWDAPSGGFTF